MLNNIFTGTENLFKLLFINGILIILIGLFYPLQKRDELELKIIEYNSNVNLLNRDISELYNQSVELKNKIKEVKSKQKTKIHDFQPQIKELHQKIYEQDKKKIEVENQKSLVDKLINQQETYNKYCKAFLVFGALITVIGLSGWSRLTYFLYDKEYSEYLQRNSQLQNRPIRTRIILSILLVIILIASIYYILN
ncbi:hypothetical protein LPB87_14410 [Flavobacterium sp. EDS]|uniref:hypothetical protein n=1 Tax=Flavobacterium sp. EDS TaxID=2897328 RepID=UPI001E3E4DE1|nr:hypothetical protein [Flavobacterium sp. EDS]MCD0475589.1 hypothetical protein [Flavobacterium sp. EDS]